MTTTNSRKVLLPLATLVAAGAVAIGSGATFTSESDRSVSVTAGTLLHTNGNDGATLTLDKIVPGDSMTGTVVVQNTGDLDSTLGLQAVVANNGFSEFLKLKVTADNDITDATPAVEIFPEAAFPSTGADLALQSNVPFAVGDEITYKFTVTLANDPSTDILIRNVDQGKEADAIFSWTQNQLPGNSSLDEVWVDAPAPATP